MYNTRTMYIYTAIFKFSKNDLINLILYLSIGNVLAGIELGHFCNIDYLSQNNIVCDIEVKTMRIIIVLPSDPLICRISFNISHSRNIRF